LCPTVDTVPRGVSLRKNPRIILPAPRETPSVLACQQALTVRHIRRRLCSPNTNIITPLECRILRRYHCCQNLWRRHDAVVISSIFLFSVH
jgi:hypothetical protein